MRRWSEWKGKYRDCLRRFIKGDAGCAPELYSRMEGSEDLYSSRGPAASINFITCHDGFTMYDLVSYNGKHNEANGEDNRDGTDCNDSWNCGAEGDTDDAEILALRMRQIRNFQTLLLTSRGVPMLLSGDEFANSQYGNNNAYWEEQCFTLPELPAGLRWHLACASRGICCPAGQETQLMVPTQFTLGPRETAVLIGK